MRIDLHETGLDGPVHLLSQKMIIIAGICSVTLNAPNLSIIKVHLLIRRPLSQKPNDQKGLPRTPTAAGLTHNEVNYMRHG